MVVHGVRGRSSDEPKLTDWLVARYPELETVGDDPEERPGIVHRLDKDTSGIMIVPRNQRSFDYFKSLFKERNIQKSYLAIVFGAPAKKEGTIDAPIGIQNGTTKRSVRSVKMAKPAVTEYKTLRIYDSGFKIQEKEVQGLERSSFSLLSVHPKTGRTHQIRVHLASIGHPVVGDSMYGGRKRVQPPWATRLMLHAASIEFTLPDGNRARFDADPPPDFYPL
jgi:23S rRNA pseudouridine1911/1915/1917 synthase